MCLKRVEKDSIDMLFNHVVPTETISYNVTDMITNLVNDTRNEMIPIIENLTYTFFDCNYCIISFSLFRWIDYNCNYTVKKNQYVD